MNINNDTWLIENSVLIRYRGSNYDKIVIPSGVKKIQFSAFDRMYIKHLILPNTIEDAYFNEYLTINKLTIHKVSGRIICSASINELEIYNTEAHLTTRIIENITSGLNVCGIKKITILGQKLSYDYLRNIYKLALDNYIKLVYKKESDFLITDTILVGYTGDSKEVVIPEGIEVIEEEAFLNKYLTNVTLPKSLKYIQDKAFAGCCLEELYLPDNLEYATLTAFTNNMIRKISINNDVTLENKNSKNIFLYKNVKYYFPYLEEIELRAQDLGAIRNIWIAKDVYTKIILENEIEYEILVKFYRINEEELINSNYTIVVMDKNQEKTRYEFTGNTIRDITIGSDISNIDINVIRRTFNLYIDNTDGKAVASFIDFLEANKGYNFPYLYHISIIGIHITKEEKRKLNKLLGNFLGLNIKYNLGPNEEKALKVLPTNETTIKTNGYNDEIIKLLTEINNKISNLNSSAKQVIKSRVEALLEKYKEDLEKIKPKLTFENSTNFGEITLTPKDLKLELITNLNVIIQKLNIENHYYLLQKELEEYEKFLKEQETYEIESVLTTSNKIKYIINTAHSYNLEEYLKELESIIKTTKEQISNYFLRRLKGGILEEESDLSIEFSLKIDSLYNKISHFIIIEKEFKDTNNSELAKDILSIKERIKEFAFFIQPKYQKELNEIVNNYYIEALNNSNKSISDIKQELSKKLNEFLEEINKNSNYYEYANILNSLNPNCPIEEKHSLAILELIEEITKLIYDTKLSKEDQEQASTELKKVLAKWENNIIQNNFSLTNEENFAIPNMPAKIEVHDNTSLQILIIKDLLTIKNSILSYLESLQDYELILHTSK